MNGPEVRIALNPIQWFATVDGWVDPAIAPPLGDRMALVSACGFTAVQTELPGSGDDGAYVRLLAEHGIVPGPGYWSAGWASERPDLSARLDAARQSASRHARMGVDLVFLSTGMTKDAVRVRRAAIGAAPDPIRLDAIAQFLDQVGKAMAEEGVRAALHPHVGTWVETEPETRWVLDHTDPDHVLFGPDIGHLAWAGADYLGLLAQYRNRIPGIHLKDFDTAVAAAGRAHKLSYQQTVLQGLWKEPGTGDCDLEAVFKTLGRHADRWVVIEVDRPGTATPQASIALCGLWARRFAAAAGH